MTTRERVSLFWLKARQPFGSFFTWLCAFVGLIGGIATIAQLFVTNETMREWVLSGTLSVITVVSLGALAWREVKLSDHRKFASTLPQLQRSSELLREIRCILRVAASEATKNNTPIPKEIRGKLKSHIEEVISLIAIVYTTWTSTNCRASIKLVRVEDIGGAKEIFVHTLARDRSSSGENHEHDKRRAKENLDKLSANSDFLGLWDEGKPDKGYFLAYDLKNDPDYDTSSLHYWNVVVGSSYRKSKKEWPLAYRSTLVWPIRQRVQEEIGIYETNCVGFLCVDSRQPGAFRSRDHPSIGKILADSLYPILDLYAKEIEPRISNAAAGGA